MFTYLSRVKTVCYLANKPPKQLQLVLGEFESTEFSPYTLTINHPKSTRIHFAIDLILGISFLISSFILKHTFKKGKLSYPIPTSLFLLGTLEIGAVFGAFVFYNNQNLIVRHRIVEQEGKRKYSL